MVFNDVFFILVDASSVIEPESPEDHIKSCPATAGKSVAPASTLMKNYSGTCKNACLNKNEQKKEPQVDGEDLCFHSVYYV